MSSRESKLDDLIIYGFIRILEKSSAIYLPIDIYRFIALFCDPCLYKAAKYKPIINIKSPQYLNTRSLIINIINKDILSNGYRIFYKAKQVEIMNKWNVIDINFNASSDREIDHEVKGTQSNTEYIICVESKNKENIYIASLKIFKLIMTSYWKFDTVTNGYDNYIENEGKTFVTKRNKYVTASYSEGYNFGIHEFHIQCFGNIHFLALSIVADHIHVANGWIFNHDDKHYYFDCDGVIYTDYDKKLKQTPRWKNGDVISMLLNCYDWTVSYAINHGPSYKIDIEKNKTYYPSFSAHYKGSRIEILS